MSSKDKVFPKELNTNYTVEDGGRLNAFAIEPSIQYVEHDNSWGFHKKAESLNGKIAMISFITILGIELFIGGEPIINKIIDVLNFLK